MRASTPRSRGGQRAPQGSPPRLPDQLDKDKLKKIISRLDDKALQNCSLGTVAKLDNFRKILKVRMLIFLSSPCPARRRGACGSAGRQPSAAARHGGSAYPAGGPWSLVWSGLGEALASCANPETKGMFAGHFDTDLKLSNLPAFVGISHSGGVVLVCSRFNPRCNVPSAAF